VTEKISTAEARSQFAEVINQVAYRGVRIVLTKHDKEVAAVIPIADLEKLALLEQSLDLQEAKDSLREAHESGALISLAELKAKLIKVK
jgi:prevent-host-death family protein